MKLSISGCGDVQQQICRQTLEGTHKDARDLTIDLMLVVL